MKNPILSLYEHKINTEEDASEYENALIAMRNTIERFANVLPGTFKCSGIVHIATITLLLKDRSFADLLKRMEEALEYAIELACLPLDILCLELEIAKWKGDVEKFKKSYEKCESIGYNFLSIMYKPTLEEFESGNLVPVDLTFVPAIVEPILTDEEKLEKLNEELKVAKQEVKDAGAAGIKEAMQAARVKAKSIKVQIKELKAEIAEKTKPTVDQAKIDELKAKIVDAQARQEQAFDDDDDEAEEKASEELLKLGEELEALTASIPKQKLEDAKKKVLQSISIFLL